ncbi:LysR family transcriptional regulator for bpeEF and oprC [Paraburkholderia bannensis]|uniref:LysR family transcriptional regulator for bpeEF and oprC n=1 Tax=Paraburkholderia bannensis TaxID=765414 RepID=A0A7W9U145_9BURK|nr:MULTISPECIES: LysR family transcriptional regulator [Paraburkholderia]MBB3262144.1 LysR family transcriptional regulator for bpeEF and oprC [Paraburkholderia sp. WP4_3_2]MBB6105139.1 LysR family transcriptional regulator for bpeEF and oprC [Paraburkholderia bannensis]
MDRFLHAMSVFVHVARLGSFTSAAEALGVATGSVSTVVRQLESYLDVALLHRSTRAMRVTADGARYYEHCVRVLAEIDDMTQALRSTRHFAQGRLCVDIDQEVACVLLPEISEFSEAYPNVELKIAVGGEPDGLISNGVDCAIVVGNLSDSSFKCRHLGVVRTVTVASPGYLAKRAIPTSPEALRDHDVVHYSPRRFGIPRPLRFAGDRSDVAVKATERICLNDAAAVLHCVLGGAGLAQVSEPIALPHLRSGQLKEVLAHHRPTASPISCVYANQRHVSMALHAFMDWATASLKSHAHRRNTAPHELSRDEIQRQACHVASADQPSRLSSFATSATEIAA